MLLTLQICINVSIDDTMEAILVACIWRMQILCWTGVKCSSDWMKSIQLVNAQSNWVVILVKDAISIYNIKSCNFTKKSKSLIYK
jgi:hypothetical protein